MDTSRVARCLREQLCQLVEQPLVPRQRLLLLESYQPHLLTLTTTLEEGLFDTSLPLPPAQAEKALLLVELCGLMARNYGLLADTWAITPTSADEVLPVLRHTLDWLARLSLHRAQIYAQPDTDFWRKVHHLYRLIEQYELLLHPAAAPVHEPLHVLFLFAACDPQRFRPREMHQIDRLLRHFGCHACIRQQARYRDLRAGFAFDCQTPAPPRPLRRMPGPPSPHRRFLFVQPVIRQLLDYVKQDTSLGIETLPFDQVRRLALELAHALGAPKQRRWLRRPQHHDCRVIAGLADLTAFLRHQSGHDLEALLQHPAAPRSEPDPPFALTLAGISLPADPDDGEGRHSEVDALRCLNDDKPRIRAEDIWGAPSQPDAREVTTFSAQMVDVSARGYRLRWQGPACPRLRPGEVLGLLPREGELEVAVIRWLHQSAEHQLTLGVELLSFSAQLVVTSRFTPEVNEDGLEPQRHWDILLPPQPAIGRETCLLAAARNWRRGQWVEIHYTRIRKAVCLLHQRLDASPAYDLFSLENVTPDAAADTRQ